MQYKVYHNGKEKGVADVFAENGALTVQYSCPFEEGRVYKLHAQLKDEAIPLGIMLKSGSSFTYKRPINSRKAGKNGENIRYFYVEKHILGSKATPPLPFSADMFAPCRQMDTPDHALQNCISDGGLLMCDFEGETYIAARLDGKNPFPLAPFFCLVTPVSHNGHTLGVIKLDGKNIPVYLNKSGSEQP